MKKPESGVFFSNPGRQAGTRVHTALPAGGKAVSGDFSRNHRQVSPLDENSPFSARRIDQLQRQMKANSRRDSQLWLIAIVVILVQTAGFAGILAPSVAWRSLNLHLDLRYFPQQFWGMLTLVVLFSIYVTMQRREVSATRAALIQELIVSEQMQSYSLLDPITRLLNSSAVDNIANREVARANRTGCALSVAVISLDNFAALQKRLGQEEAEKALFYAARLFESTFRGSDALFRHGLHEFTLIMPETTEEQASTAISRLRASCERWNAETETGLELSFSAGVASHSPGANMSDVIERARRCMFLSSQKVNLVF
jgi:diguanylate cyclase (GGDEF)-like protein